MSLLPMIGFTAVSDWWVMASSRVIDGFEVIVSKNKFMFEESSIAFETYFFCEGFDACLLSVGFAF